MYVFYFLIILFLSYLLGKTADFLAKALGQIKKIARLNEFIAAFFILGAVTSAPEIFVAILSAIKGTPELSLGNLLGSNIVVLAFLLGLTAVFSGGFKTGSALRKRELIYTLTLVGTPVLFIVDGFVSRWEGIIMLGIFALYCYHFFLNRRYYSHKPGPEAKIEKSSPLKYTAMFLFAAISLLTVSYFLVEVSTWTASMLKIPAVIVGLLVISIGTNMPEVAFVAKQLSKSRDKYRDIAYGILLGNTIFNVPILGTLAIIRPFEIVNLQMIWAISFLLIITLIMLGNFLAKDKKLSRFEGLLLLLVYTCFVTYLVTSMNLTGMIK